MIDDDKHAKVKQKTSKNRMMDKNKLTKLQTI